MVSLLVVSSSRAGGDDAALTRAVGTLRDGGEVELARTDGPDELDRLLDVRAGRTLVVAGGDGTLHAVVAALDRRDELRGTVLGLLPLGTGNDFARGLGIPLAPAAAAGVILAGHHRPVDLLRSPDPSDHAVVNAAHVGAGAHAAWAGADWKQRLGRIGYPIGALVTALRPPELRLEIEVDGQPLARPKHGVVLQVAVGIGGSVGGGAKLIPQADPGDGAADVLVSFAVSPLARLGYAAALLRGRHPRRPDVISARGQHIRLRGDPFWCSADGELSGPHISREWRLQPAAYDVFVPSAPGVA